MIECSKGALNVHKIVIFVIYVILIQIDKIIHPVAFAKMVILIIMDRIHSVKVNNFYLLTLRYYLTLI